MDVSVIIPTFNGANKLPSIIYALGKQTYQPREVIIVVDGSKDNTISVLKLLQKEYNILKVVVQENKGRAAVRNRGAKEATGDLLIFFDDDMLPLSNCIQQHLSHHQKHSNTILTGGLSEVVNKNSKDILKYREHLSRKWNDELNTDEDGKLLDSSLFLMAAHCSIPKRVFKMLSGFDERLNDAEDFDLAVRAVKAGIPLFFKKKIFAWHNDAVTCKTYIKRQRQYALAHKALVILKPWLADEGYINHAIIPKGWRKRMFSLFLNKKWINAVDQNYFKVFPQKMRYKLYDLIITANGVFFPEKVQL